MMNYICINKGKFRCHIEVRQPNFPGRTGSGPGKGGLVVNFMLLIINRRGELRPVLRLGIKQPNSLEIELRARKKGKWRCSDALFK